jgi:hypothetical protein
VASDYFNSDELTAAVVSGCVSARLETVEAGILVFYRDAKTNIYIMEQPDGRRFEIRLIRGAPRERNYEVLWELGQSAA